MGHLDKRGGELVLPTAARARLDLQRPAMKPGHHKNAAIPPALVSFVNRMGVPLLLFLLCVLGDAACSPGDPGGGADGTGKNLSALPAGVDATCPGPDVNSNLPPRLPLPESTAPVGTIPGTFAVGPSGQATYTMSIEVPPGRHGMEPSLGFRYDSTSGDGVLGLGFSVTGLSAITRCPKTLARDGVIQDVRYQGGDAFCLDGQRLVEVPTTNTNQGGGGLGDQTEYRTFPDTFARIIAFRPPKSATYDPATGPLFWIETTKAGLTQEFGGGNAAEANDETSGVAFALKGAVRSWRLARVIDRRGNTVEYTYQKDVLATALGNVTTEIVPALIRYTGNVAQSDAVPRNAVRFNYDTKDPADNRTLLSGGMTQKSSRRLKSIQTLTTNGVAVREYDFSYELGTNSGRTLLSQVQECSISIGRACKPPTRFSWDGGPAAGFDAFAAAATRPNADGAMLAIMDVNGDGLDDVVTSDFFSPDGNNLFATFQTSMNSAAPSLPAPTQGLALNVVTPQSMPPTPMAGTPIDYDQDGKADLLLHDNNHQFGNFQVLVTKQTGSSAPTFEVKDTGIANPGQTRELGGQIARTHLADLNGDGVPDLIVCTATFGAPGSATESWVVHPWAPTPPNYFQSPGIPIDVLNANNYPCDGPFFVADLNADGKADLLFSTVSSDAGTLADPIDPVPPGATYAVLGAKNTPANGPWTWEGPWQSNIPVRRIDTIIFMDVNGDGLPDAVQSGEDDFQIHVLINIGNTFGIGTGFPDDNFALSSIPDGVFTGELIDLARPIDFNADGRQDLLIPMRATGGGPRNWFILQSTGVVDNAGAFTPIMLPYVYTSGENDPSIAADFYGARVTDLDGDGAADVVLRLNDRAVSTPNNLTVLKGTARRDAVLRITDGLTPPDQDAFKASTVSIIYHPLVDVDITVGQPPSEDATYQKQNDLNNRCVYPRKCVVGTQQVVAGYQLDDGLGAGGLRTFFVSYRDGRFDSLMDGWLGFESKRIVELGTLAGTLELFDNSSRDEALKSYRFVGIPTNQWSWSPAPGMAGALMEVSYTDTTLDTFPTNGGNSFFRHATRRIEERAQTAAGADLTTDIFLVGSGHAGSVAQTISTSTRLYGSIDPYGNVWQEQVTTAGVDLTDTVKRIFLPPDLNNWFVGQLNMQTETSSTTTPMQSQTRTEAFTYYPSGEVQTATRSGDDDSQRGTFARTLLNSHFTYDGFGNVIATRLDDGGVGDQDHRASCVSYDADGYFPHATDNGLGQNTFMQYDAGRGVQTAFEDVNGLVTRSFFDGFGRRTRDVRPDGTATTYVLAEVNAGQPIPVARFSLTATTSPQGGIDTTEFDSLGRPVRAFSEAPCPAPCAAAPRIVQTVAYDPFGNIIARSIPTSEATFSASTPGDVYTYDGVHRVLSHTTPWGALTTYAYVGNTTTVTDAHGVTVLTSDALQRPATVLDATQKGTTQYSYGPFSQLATVTDPIGATTTMVHDPLGRVVEFGDPDRGKTTSIYDGFGDLRSSVDELGRSITFSYDAVGRRTRRVDLVGGVQTTTQWNWDTAANGIGKIGTIVNPTATQTWGYDGLGRIHMMELSKIDGEDLKATLDYDPASGLPTTLTYPETEGATPFAVQNIYDPHGYLVGVVSPGRNFAYWTIQGADDAGRISKEAFGNGVITNRTYDSARDRLKNIETEKGAEVFQNLLYDYDARQNLLHRSDQHDPKAHVTEAFGYDPLDRLTCARVRQGEPAGTSCTTSTFTYDPSGNLTLKDGNQYGYGDLANQPHAVRTVGRESYQYDAVGNQTHRTNGVIVHYTPFDLPSDYTGLPGGPVAFEYDGSQDRIRKETPEDVTLYLGGFYERVLDKSSKSVTQRYYIRSSERVIAVKEREGRARPFPPGANTVYIHTDNVGSVDVITDDRGTERERRSYDAFGARRNKVWNHPTPKSFGPRNTTLDYTGQEFDDELGLVNMKGRIYDPKLGRFLTTDPIVSRPLSGQSWNPYTYVRNNPLKYVDPSGFEDDNADGDGDGPPPDAVQDTKPAPDPGQQFPVIATVPVTIVGDRPNSGDSPDAPVVSVTPPTDMAPTGAPATVPTPVVSGTAGDPGMGPGEAGPPAPSLHDAIVQNFKAQVPIMLSMMGTITSVGPTITLVQQVIKATDEKSSHNERVTAAVGIVLSLAPEFEEGVAVLGPAVDILDAAAPGSFSIIDWTGYPQDIPKPQGPLVVLEGEPYAAARSAANRANASIRASDPAAFAGKQIHEIQPIKFGGDPTNPANKLVLTPTEHAQVTTWWNQFLRNMR